MTVNLTPRMVAYVVFKRRRAIFTFLLFCLAMNALYIFLSPWKYESDVQVMVKVNFNNPDLARADFGSANSAGSSVQPQQISSDVIKSVVGSYISMVKSQDVERPTIEKVGVASLYPSIASRPPPAGATVMDKAIEQLDRDLDVKQVKDSNTIQISLLNGDAVTAQKATTTLLSQFIALQQSAFRPADTPFLQAQLDAAQAKLQDEQNALSQFKVAHQLSSLADERTQLLQKHTDVFDNLDTARGALSSALARRDALKQSLQDYEAHATYSNGTDASSRQLDDAQARLTAQIERANAAHATYASNNAFVVAADTAVADARKRLEDLQHEIDRTVKGGASPVDQALKTDALRNDAEVAGAQAQVASTEKDIATINGRLLEIDSLEGQLNQLETRVQVAQDNLATQLHRLEESRISSDLNKSQITSLTVVQQPTLGYKIARPRWQLTTALAVLLGVFGGLAFSFLLESMSETFGLPEQLEDSIRLPVFATLNLLPRQAR